MKARNYFKNKKWAMLKKDDQECFVLKVSFEHIRMSEPMINKELESLVTFLERDSLISTLTLEGKVFGDASALLIARLLKTNTALHTLSITNGQITDVGAKEIAEALKNNQGVTRLYMPGNQIGDKGAIAIAECLVKKEPLVCLVLDKNQIGPSGSQFIADALAGSLLKMLSLSDNPIGDPSAAALFTALETNKTMTMFCMDGVQIGKTCRDALARTLRANTTLRELRLNNGITDADAAAIGKSLKENTSLVSLGLCSGSLTPIGVNSIAQALKTNVTLRRLFLKHNYYNLDRMFLPLCGLAMIDALKKNHTLTTLVSPCTNEQTQEISQMLTRNSLAARKKTLGAVATISVLKKIRARGGPQTWTMPREIIGIIGKMIKYDETHNAEWVKPERKPQKSLKLILKISPKVASTEGQEVSDVQAPEPRY